MRPEDFRLRLDAASFYATHFAASMVKGRLGNGFRYCVVLNASQDEGLPIFIVVGYWLGYTETERHDFGNYKGDAGMVCHHEYGNPDLLVTVHSLCE